METAKLYVELLEEGVDVWRPVHTVDRTLQNKIEVVIEYIRVDPRPSRLVRSERIEWPNA